MYLFYPCKIVAENVDGVEKGDWFTGFFTSKTVVQKVIDEINHMIMTHIDFFDSALKEIQD